MGIKFDGCSFDTHMFPDADWAGDMLAYISCMLEVETVAGQPGLPMSGLKSD